jgi:hypothetical protein
MLLTLTNKRLAEEFRPVEEGLAVVDEGPKSNRSSKVRNNSAAMQYYN